VRQRITDPNIWLVYAAVLLVGTAYGTSLAVLALFLDARHFDAHQIGALAACFASGIVALSLPMGTLVRRFTARRVLVASLVGYAVTVAAFPFLHGFLAAAVARFFDGAFSVGVWVSCETILLSRADARNKAFVMSLYAISLAVGYIVGPLAAKGVVAIGTMHWPFVLSGILGTAAAVLVLLRLDEDVNVEFDRAPSRASFVASTATTSQLAWKTKTSCLATFAYGYFQASVVLFLPLFLVESKHITREQTIVIPAFFAAGMLLFSNFAARLGDRHGHLVVMRVLGAIGTSMVVGFVVLESFAAMCVAVFVAGATLASISPLSLALQGVVVAPEDYGRANAVYNGAYAAGMLLGPPLSSALFRRFGGAVMLDHLAALWVGFVLFTAIFAKDDPAANRRAADDEPLATAPTESESSG
jgi:MFS family permease